MLFHFLQKLIFSKRAGSLIRRISLLSVAGISFSIASFLIVMSIMNGMNQSLRNRIMALEPHLVLEYPNNFSFSQIYNHESLRILKSVHGSQVFEFESQDLLVRTLDGKFRGAIAKGLNEESLGHLLTEIKKMDRAQGAKSIDLLNSDLDLPGAGEIIVGIDLARALNLFEGDEVVLVTPEALILSELEVPKMERVKVRKIISTNLADIDRQYIFYPSGKSLISMDSLSRRRGMEVWLSDAEQAPQISKNFNFSDVKVSTWIDRNSDLFFALKMEKLIIAIFLSLAGLISSSSILTILMLIVTQKRRDIAILQSLGLSAAKAVKILVGVGCSISGIGIFLGLVLGLSVSYYIQYFPIRVLPTTIYYDAEIPAQVKLSLAIISVFCAGLISFFGAWIPARSVFKLDASKVLRG